MPFIPKPSFEFSVPNEQSEIDAILDAVQGGKQIPVFGNGNGKKPAVLNNGGSEKSKSKPKAAVPWDEKV